MNLTSVFRTRQPKYDTRTVIVQYSAKNVSVFFENRSNKQVKRRVVLKQDPILVLNQQTQINNLNLFNKTFREYERMESITINQLLYYTSIVDDKPKLFDYKMPEDYILNYYHLQLNQSYFNISYIYALKPEHFERNTIMTLDQKSYYKEFGADYKTIENKVS